MTNTEMKAPQGGQSTDNAPQFTSAELSRQIYNELESLFQDQPSDDYARMINRFIQHYLEYNHCEVQEDKIKICDTIFAANNLSATLMKLEMLKKGIESINNFKNAQSC